MRIDRSKREPPPQFTLLGLIFLTTVSAALLVPARLMLNDPTFRLMAIGLAFMVSACAIITFVHWRQVQAQQWEIGRLRCKMIAEQTAKRAVEKTLKDV